jgi:hypothetical protein
VFVDWVKKLSAYVGGHVFVEWWVELHYIASAVVGGGVVVVECESVFVPGVFECMLVRWSGGLELVFVTGDVR